MNTPRESALKRGGPARFLRTSTLAVLAGCAFAGVGLGFHALTPQASAQTATADAVSRARERANDLSVAFREVAKSLRPAVVTIHSSRKPPEKDKNTDNNRRNRRRGGNPSLDDFFDFFGPDGMNRQGEGESSPREWGGTGFIVSKDGYVLTNNHVVGKADELKVTLSDKREFVAKVIGTDDHSDLAILKIDAKDLPFAELGSSDALEVGDWVLAIGSPFMLEQTVTAGIVSAKGRTISPGDSKKYEDYIQTDAAINQGNSGGPLVNLEGKVIGINTLILSSGGGNWSGIGFAIPSRMAEDVKNQIIKNGKVTRGWLGVAIQPLTEDMAKSFNFKTTEGILVGQVNEGSPAAEGGMKDGDIITGMNGKPIADVNQLRNTVAATSPGTQVPFDVYRNGKTEKVTVKVGDLDKDKKETASATEAASKEEEAADIGVTVQSLTTDVAEQLKVPAGRGVVVTDVEQGGVAAQAGMRRGDVILTVDGSDVGDPAKFRAELKKGSLEKGIRLQVLSNGTRGFVFLKRRG